MSPLNSDETEIILGGGRTGSNVVRVGDTVRKPTTNNSEYASRVLKFLEEKHFNHSQRYLGKDEKNRDIFAYIEGHVPDDIGDTTDQQLHQFMKIVRQFHDLSKDFLKSNELVLCHDDLSPCNVVFRENSPIAIIDWCDVHPNTRWQDLTYILWLWINLGTHEEDRNMIPQMVSALNAYDADEKTRQNFAEKLINRMTREIVELEKTRCDYTRVEVWVNDSIHWVEKNREIIQSKIG
jgi:thiamine kinase-like enzyme